MYKAVLQSHPISMGNGDYVYHMNLDYLNQKLGFPNH